MTAKTSKRPQKKPEVAKKNQGGISRFKPGQSGNPAGRPRGSRNKLSDDFLKDFHEAWGEHGRTALKTMAEEKPTEFVKAAVQLMPRDLHVKADASEAFVKIWEAISKDKVIDGLAGSVDAVEGQPADLRAARPEGNA